MVSTYMAASWLLKTEPKKSKRIDKTFSAGKLFAFHFVDLINALAAHENIMMKRSHLSKGTISDLEQNGTQEKTPFSGPVFYFLVVWFFFVRNVSH